MSASAEPTFQICGDKVVVTQIAMNTIDPIDLLFLPRAKTFCGIETPDALQQPLPSEDLVAARDAAMKIIGDVEESAVAIRDTAI
jgi:hypothetical protein